MSKQDEAGLILHLYDQRREEVMRTARNWVFSEFNPEIRDQARPPVQELAQS